MAKEKSEFIQFLKLGDINSVRAFVNEDFNWHFMALDDLGAMSIHFATEAGQLELVKYLFSNEPRLVNKSNSKNETPLHYAARNGHFPVIAYLLQNEVDFSRVAKESGSKTDGKTALDYAKEGGHSDCVKLIEVYWLYKAIKSGDFDSIKNSLLNHAIDPKIILTGNHEHAIHIASKKGHVEIVELLLAKNPDLVDLNDGFGNTPLILAAANGRDLLVQMLTQRYKADINAANKSFEKPLDLARKGKYLKCIEILEKAQFDLFKKGHYSSNLHSNLEVACREGCLEQVKILCKENFDKAIYCRPFTLHIFQFVASLGHLNLVKFLFERNPEFINKRCSLDRTALHYAVLGGHLEVVTFLIENNAEIEAPSPSVIFDLYGKTPFHYALRSCFYRIANLLLLKTTLETPEQLINFIYSADQAIDMMILQPALSEEILKNPTILGMLKKSPSFKLNNQILEIYHPASPFFRTNSFYALIDKEKKIATVFEPDKNLHEGRTCMVRRFKSKEGQKIIVKSEIKSKAKNKFHSIQKEMQQELKLTKLANPDSSPLSLFSFFEKINRFVKPYEEGFRAKKCILNIKSEYKLAEIVLLSAEALRELHGQNIIHGDIHEGNILIDPRLTKVKYIDFGRSYTLNDDKAPQFLGEKADRQWYAPERIVQNEGSYLAPNPNQDIYSFGVMLDALFEGHPSRDALMQQFPCIDEFIQHAQNIIPEKRPGLDSFCTTVVLMLEKCKEIATNQCAITF
jgi:ankyrin repeat protein/serine/threonine protein kinase